MKLKIKFAIQKNMLKHQYEGSNNLNNSVVDINMTETKEGKVPTSLSKVNE